MTTTTIKPRTASVTIFQGDYLDDIEHLRRKAEAAQEAESRSPRMLAEVPESQALIEQHDALVKEAEETAVTVKVRNLGRRQYHDLKVKHPPRLKDDNERVVEADKALGCNEDTFFDELVPLSLVAPSFDSDQDRQRFLEDLSPIDWERVKLAAFGLNERVAADPKLFPVSKPTSESDET